MCLPYLQGAPPGKIQEGAILEEERHGHAAEVNIDKDYMVK